MITIYLFPTGENLYTAKGREQGHRFVTLTRAGLKQVKTQARRLRERGVQKVFCSDLHGQSGHAVGRELRVPVMEERSFRHFNVGRLAGKSRDIVETVIEDVAKKWDANPTIPISGGDSWTSYGQRIQRGLQSLRRSKLTSVVLVLDPRTFQTVRCVLAQGYGQAAPSPSLLQKHNDTPTDKIIVVKFGAA